MLFAARLSLAAYDTRESFRRVFALRVVVVRLKRAAPARLANTVSVLDPFGHDQ
jgi:hypothetical protein